MLNVFIFSLLLNFAFSAQQESINNKIIFENVDRSIDISSQIVKIINKIHVTNHGNSPINSLLFCIHPGNTTPAYLLAQTAVSRINLKLKETKIKNYSDKTCWKIQLNNPLAPNEALNFEVNEFWTKKIIPHPQSITQKEKQLVKYTGDASLYSPYKINKLTTTVVLHTRNIEFYTKIKPSTISDGSIIYVPFYNIAPFSINPIEMHYENNSPFLLIKKLKRIIEISHWGNIAVEETVDLIHTGAKLKGSFSRYDYQRESGTGHPSVKSFKMMLPAAAIGTYYRDDIGNISTSYMRVMKDAVELELRPRFPLFGGWRTQYVIGYNVPSYEYLYNSGKDYLLKMRLIDHVFDDMVVEKLVTKIILPERIHDIQLTTPYPTKRLPDKFHYTYLDTSGRPVVTLTKENLIENHIQDFQLRYKFSSFYMLQEPILVIIALYSVFLFVIIYVRLDFSIFTDAANENRLRVAGICEKIMMHQDKRLHIYQSFDNHFSKLKSTKDVNSFSCAAKALNAEYKTETNLIADFGNKLKPYATDLYEKLLEMQRLDRNLKELYQQQQNLYVVKFVTGKLSRSAYIDVETNFSKRKFDLLNNINHLCRAFE